jgi:hypothetical protein
MSNIELSIWAAMLGALLVFFGGALTDAIRNPTLAAWRAVGFVLLVGSTSMIMSGWFEYVVQIRQSEWLMPAKVTLGPLSGALALFYLGVWFGKLAQDSWLNRLIVWGSMLQCVSAVALLIAIWIWPEQGHRLLLVAFGVNMIGVVTAFSTAARGVALGDRLAWAMLCACASLGVMVVGLYAKGLNWASSYILWALTALCTAIYFFVTTVLTIERNRQMRLLKRMSEGVAKTDEITGLPVGGTLLSKIDDVIWRSVRIERECVVMAVWIDNLYARHEEQDASVEHEIRHVLAARIHRSIGFRHCLGLQQSRCFMAGISAINDRQRVISTMPDFLSRLLSPIQVGVMLGQPTSFTPKVGVGMIFVGTGHMTDPLSAMDQAVTLAKRALREPSRVLSQEAIPMSSISSRKTLMD